MLRRAIWLQRLRRELLKRCTTREEGARENGRERKTYAPIRYQIVLGPRMPRTCDDANGIKEKKLLGGSREEGGNVIVNI